MLSRPPIWYFLFDRIWIRLYNTKHHRSLHCIGWRSGLLHRFGMLLALGCRPSHSWVDLVISLPQKFDCFSSVTMLMIRRDHDLFLSFPSLLTLVSLALLAGNRALAYNCVFTSQQMCSGVSPLFLKAPRRNKKLACSYSSDILVVRVMKNNHKIILGSNAVSKLLLSIQNAVA